MIRRAVLSSVLALVAVLTACAGGSPTAAPDSRSGDRPLTTTGAPDAPDGAALPDDTPTGSSDRTDTAGAGALADLLLDPADVGAGWTMEATTADADFGSLGDSTCEGQSVDPVIVERVRLRAGVQLKSPQPPGIVISQAILEAPEVQLAEDLDEVFRVDSACSGTDILLNDTTTARADLVDLDRVGDEQQAARLSILVGSDVVSAGYIAIVRVGRYAFELSLMVDTGPGTNTAVPEASEFVRLLRTAVAELGA